MKKIKLRLPLEDLVVKPEVELRHLRAEEMPRFQEKVSKQKVKPGKTLKYDKNWLLQRCKYQQWTGCWEWGRRVNEDGYARANIGGHMIGMSKLAYMLWRGNIPNGMWVLHKCDNRRCCNPNHLFLGTHKDNMRDALKKGRLCGSGVGGKRRFSESEIREIRSNGKSTYFTARLFKAHTKTIREIRKNVNYKDV